MTNIIVLGGGYAGLKTAVELQKRIKRSDVHISIVNKNSYHYESTWLHEVSAGSIDEKKATYSIASLLKNKNVSFIEDTVIRIDKEERKVILEGRNLTYDYLVVALGFESETYGTEGVEEFCFALTSKKSAVYLKETIEKNIAQLGETSDPFVITVVGAGFTGVELLGELSVQVPLLCEKFHIDHNRVTLRCIHPKETVLPNFPPTLCSYAEKKLIKKGVEFSPHTFLKEAKEKSISITRNGTEEELSSDITIWTAGVKGNAVIAHSGFTHTHNRVEVNEFSQVDGYPEVFVIGDCSHTKNPKTGDFYPPTAQIAIQQGENVAKNIDRLLRNRVLKPFVFHYKGTVCSLGNTDGVGVVFGFNIRGYFASLMKKVIDDRSLLMIGGFLLLFKKGKI